MSYPGTDHLRVLIANQRPQRLDRVTTIVASLGHEVIARSIEVEDVAELTARERPDVALVGLGESSDALFGSAGIGGTTHFTAYDKATGAVVWQTTLPAGTTGGPVTYEVAGRQIIVVPLGNKEYGASWVALGLKP